MKTKAVGVAAAILLVAVLIVPAVQGASGGAEPRAEKAGGKLVPIKRLSKRWNDKRDYSCPTRVYDPALGFPEGEDIKQLTFKLNRSKVKMTMKVDDPHWRVVDEGEPTERVTIGYPGWRLFVNPSRSEKKWGVFNYREEAERVGHEGYLTFSNVGSSEGFGRDEDGMFLARAKVERHGAVGYNILGKVKASLSKRDNVLTLKFPLKAFKKALPKRKQLKGVAFGAYSTCEVRRDSRGSHYSGDLAPGGTLTRRVHKLIVDYEGVKGKLAYVKLAKKKRR